MLNPAPSGRMRSRRITAGSALTASRRAASPPCASSTRYPASQQYFAQLDARRMESVLHDPDLRRARSSADAITRGQHLRCAGGGQPGGQWRDSCTRLPRFESPTSAWGASRGGWGLLLRSARKNGRGPHPDHVRSKNPNDRDSGLPRPSIFRMRVRHWHLSNEYVQIPSMRALPLAALQLCVLTVMACGPSSGSTATGGHVGFHWRGRP